MTQSPVGDEQGEFFQVGGDGRDEREGGAKVVARGEGVRASNLLAAEDESAARVGPDFSAERPREELAPETDAQHSDAAAVDRLGEETTRGVDPGFVVVGAVVGTGDDEAGVGVQLGELGELAGPTPMVFPPLAVDAQQAGERDRVAVPLHRVLAVEHGEAPRRRGRRHTDWTVRRHRGPG